ncbi:MAG: serine/threonine-protein kinase [Leptolyngbyaceae cyanobacterium MO_188.B28]|nr:serine/threonine-protein kinase [Leptolyngbyaceae cyanobacterium MO_188.B28]
MHSDSNQWVGENQRYHLEKRLGGGGMGDVFLATDTRLGKSVALKLLKESLAGSDEMRMRFERELAICAALKSQHIVQVSDYGVTLDGHPFYVMEYLQGQTLGELLRHTHQLPVQQACNIITQVCAGLQPAHEGVFLKKDGKGGNERIKVVHRDLKPANIFLVPTALGDLVKIIDFGIAKIRHLQAEYTNATEVFLGTCHYSAPEQLEAIKELDERADIYSLGLILYEMLTGVDPFGLDFKQTPVSGERWIFAHAAKTPQTIRSQPGCEKVSPELEAVVLRCLQKSPKDRFSSVQELNQALQTAVSGLSDVDRFQNLSQLSQQPSATDFSPEESINEEFINTVINSSFVAANSVSAAAMDSSPIDLTANQSISPTKLQTTDQQFLQRSGSRSINRWLMVGGAAAALVLGVTAILRLSPFNAPREEQVRVKEPSLSFVRSLSGHTDDVWSVAISTEGETLVSGSQDQSIKVWDSQSGILKRTISGHAGAVQFVALSPDNQRVVSASADQTIKVWELQTGKSIYTLTGHEDTIWSVAISPDSRLLASSSADRTIKLWNFRTGKLIRTLQRHTDEVFSVAFGPTGRLLASASQDKTIKLWDVAIGQEVNTLKGHNDSVRAIAFDPRGEKLASASWDRTVKLWDAQTGKELTTLSGHTDRVMSLAFSPDGQTLVSGSADQDTRFRCGAGP